MNIVNRDGKVLYESKKRTRKEALTEAVASGADLSGAYLSRADLSRADLSGADLSGADLSRADLSGADLSGAYLSGADLSGAYLSRADLSGANLYGAYLSRADLSGANLSGAYLSGADLSGADLSRADLSGADLSGARGINPYRTTDLLMLLDQPGPIIAYKLVNEAGEGYCRGGINYLDADCDSWEVADADTNPGKQCGAGINVATLPWIMRDWQPGYRILKLQFTAADIACIPTCTDGKFRLFRAQRVGEVDLVQIGLVEAETPEVPA
jgi:uncharacterized protein YjbI with pentapeptide repeats